MKKFILMALFGMVVSLSYGQKIHTKDCRYYNPDKVLTDTSKYALCKICHKSSSKDAKTDGTQCTATTKKGIQCKNRAKTPNGHCAIHSKNEELKILHSKD